MSFSWRTNSWGGEVGNDNLSKVNVVNNFPAPPGYSQTISQQDAHSLLYRIPDYMILKDMTVDKHPLIYQRGGYSSENPNKQPPKLHCLESKQSSDYYCSGEYLAY